MDEVKFEKEEKEFFNSQKVMQDADPYNVQARIEEEEEKKKVIHRVFPETHSEKMGQLAAALAKAQGSMINAIKNIQGYGYKYANLGAIIEIARKPLSDNELAVIQTHELVKGKTPSVVTHTTIMHSSGEWHKSSIELSIKHMPQLSPAQMIGVNCTYGRRYALQAMFLIAADEDTDAAIENK